MTQKPTILLVEDDEFLQRMYSKKFEREGLEILLASDGQQALDILRKKKIDLALVDILMPNMDGFELLKSMRESDKTVNIPVIVLTNLNSAQDINRAKQYNVVEYVVKANFLPSEVLEIVKKYINGKYSEK